MNIKRTGWVLCHVEDPERIAGHMYRMGIMTFLLDDDKSFDKVRCLKLALVHDLAECIVGDITPCCGVAPEEKHRREDNAMQELAQLAGSCGTELYCLYKEYEEQKTPEAKLVKELDRFDMILQAFEYETVESRPHGLQEFFDSTAVCVALSFLRRSVLEIECASSTTCKGRKIPTQLRPLKERAVGPISIIPAAGMRALHTFLQPGGQPPTLHGQEVPA
ncbi:HD domain-containing protein 2 isoform X2 [Cryptotermes secundus]|uniref:HD domain-containing protein 2 isoform X2 n=1 Tax=Cryptotermes secundus TaxID=105785 RepID=UPI000CD7CF8F|nr:HD domain-containing protein 2 isoform X2 [Cryptotermes secundus]